MANEAQNILNKLYSVALSKVNKLEIKADRYKGFIKWGKKNDWGTYLLGLAKNQSAHGAILSTKADYLQGQGLETENETFKLWKTKANPKETWDEVGEKCLIDKPIFGAFALKIVPNIFGTPLEHYHIDYGKLRMSTCFKEVIYSDDWSLSEYECPRINYPIWYEGCTEVAIDIVMDYFPTTKKIEAAYGHQEYSSVITDIDTDVRVSTYFNVLVQNNFNPGALVTIFKNNPTKEEKAYVNTSLKGEYSGEENVGNVLVAYANEGAKGAEVASLGVNGLDKQYHEVTNRNKANIIMGHKINPILAGLQTDGKLGLTQELKQSHHLFINNYAIPNQKTWINTVEKYATIETKQDAKGQFTIKQLDLIDLELPLDNQNIITAIGQEAYANYIYKTFNIERHEVLDANGVPVVTTGVSVNDNMKGLSASENADVLRIVRDFQKGRSGMTEAMAISRISSYGVTEQEARKWLGINDATTLSVNMSAVIRTPKEVQLAKSNRFVNLMKKYSHPIVEDDEVLEIKFCKSSEDLKLSYVKMASSLTQNQLRNAILNQIKGNPNITPEELAANFGVEVATVQSEMEWLISKNLLEDSVGGFIPSKKAYNKNTDTVTEVYTEYYYDLRDGVAPPVILATTRDWCAEMYSLHSESKLALSFDKIDDMENEFGMNAFDFRGGWYNDGAKTTKWCRHGWFGRTKIRNVNK